MNMENAHSSSSENTYFLSNHTKNAALNLRFQEEQPTALLNFLSEQANNQQSIKTQSIAEFLFNHDSSCWMTNLAPHGCTFVIHKQSRRNLQANQVIFLHDGDFVSFYGQLFQALFRKGSLLLKPLPAMSKESAAA
ncbi:MAG: hypothetical protein H7A32_05210 [Deltaproteobacteria bacterium]|nr:hypothetical protein [Deltaproteobacteria bacterium]